MLSQLLLLLLPLLQEETPELLPGDVPQVVQAELDLFEVNLGAGAIAGFDVAWQGWTGSRRASYDPATWAAHDGVRFVGAGADMTHIVPNLGGTTSADSTIFIGAEARLVEFVGLTIHCGSRKAIHAGVAKRDRNRDGRITYPEDHLPFTLRMRDCAVVADEPPAGSSRGNSSVWGIFTYSAHIDLENVVLDCLYTAEHALYAHGFSAPGLHYRNVTVLASGGECVKVATRPSEVLFVPGCTILVEQSTFSNWGPQPWSWRGGCAIGAFQGTGCDIVIDQCVAIDRPGRNSRGLMIDDGGTDHYGTDGTSGGSPANGRVVIRRTLLAGQGPSWYSPLLRVGSLSPGTTWDVAAALLIEGCGLYGVGTKAEIQRMPSGRILVRDNNTSEIDSASAAIGVDITVESALSVNGAFMPISAGFVPQN